MFNSLKTIIVIAAAGVILVVCSNTTDQNGNASSDALIVVAGVQSPKYQQFNGAYRMNYELQADYPANEIIAYISKQLKAKGWKPLRQDYLNPGMLTSHAKGWTSFTDASTTPQRTIHLWQGDWVNESKATVRYRFTYEYSKEGKPDLRNLQVWAIYVPPQVAESLRESALEHAIGSSEVP